jgi:hypothetical protein
MSMQNSQRIYDGATNAMMKQRKDKVKVWYQNIRYNISTWYEFNPWHGTKKDARWRSG